MGGELCLLEALEARAVMRCVLLCTMLCVVEAREGDLFARSARGVEDARDAGGAGSDVFCAALYARGSMKVNSVYWRYWRDVLCDALYAGGS